MRYSVLVYLVNMSRTLIEAAEYLTTSPSEEMQAEIYENGEMMLVQMREALLQHEQSLKSDLPIKWIDEISQLWKEGRGTGQTLIDDLAAFVQALPVEVDYKVRAAFVAELGEKWDSMASVYAYMRNDPRFDPVVVMEPVFRRVKWGEEVKQEVIYKDYLTAMGIPYLDYNKYSMEKDCPDLAFICQPYESCTLPQFWPENIAKYTRLVYLPYFLPRVGVKGNITTLCQMPVYACSWRVIGLNDQHFSFYSKYAPNQGKNMLVTGLPKLDHIVNLKKHDVPLPAGWEKINDKKVFLWNTWYNLDVSSLVFFDEITEWFKVHNDCALIWRPHPMTDTVTKLYLPNLYPKLQECRRIIKEMPNAVLDENASYDAAFYFSDAMISDPSSMVTQYLLMDKPLLQVSPTYSPKKFTDEELAIRTDFVPPIWMETAYNKEDEQLALMLTIDFLMRTKSGEDKNAQTRREIIERYLAAADGVCGARVCNVLWDELHKNDSINFSN